MRALRVIAAVCLAIGVVRQVSAQPPGSERLRLFADLDDDDDDGVPDALSPELSARASKDVHWLAGAARPAVRVAGDALRIAPVRGGRVALQGVRAGRAAVETGRLRIETDVVEVRALDGSGKSVDLATSHASITRSLPAFLARGEETDTDALRWLFAGPAGAVPEKVKLVSTRPDGSALDEIASVPLAVVRCPEDLSGELVCRQSASIRATSDAIDRGHPESKARSLGAEVGGRIAVVVDGKKVARIRVGGPRQSELGALARYRGRLRVRVLRNARGGAPALGTSTEEALHLAALEVETASRLWGQCGIHFGLRGDLDIAVVDPPPAHLLSIGCGFGVPASGGQVRFAVGKRRFVVDSAAGDTPLRVATRTAELLRKSGIGARVSENPRTTAGALGSVDVLVRGPGDKLLAVEPDGERPLSSDPTLAVCLGAVDLRDGLSHFGDSDAAAGTVEERALIKAFDDGDPSTIEVFIVPAFAESARIGESFIYADGSSVRNAVIIDRAAVRAGARSYALAHELGHVLLEMPGHPDDFGVDQPSALMDADAADPTIFGPRRLSVAECERAVRQSGPRAPVPLLEEWPLYRSPKGRAGSRVAR